MNIHAYDSFYTEEKERPLIAQMNIHAYDSFYTVRGA
jgi:hypothetical protein